MKKNIVIIILSVLLLGSLVGIFMLSQNVTTCPECEKCSNICPSNQCEMCLCAELEEINDWNKMTDESFIQEKYEGNNDIPKYGVRIFNKEDLLKYIQNSKDKNKIISDFEKYDLEKGTYILYRSEYIGCSGKPSKVNEILIKDNNVILIKEDFINKQMDITSCIKTLNDVYGIYIPLKISDYTIIK